MESGSSPAGGPLLPLQQPGTHLHPIVPLPSTVLAALTFGLPAHSSLASRHINPSALRLPGSRCSPSAARAPGADQHPTQLGLLPDPWGGRENQLKNEEPTRVRRSQGVQTLSVSCHGSSYGRASLVPAVLSLTNAVLTRSQANTDK